MCQSCKRDLNTTYKFYLRCLNSHKKLEEYYDLNLKSSLLLNGKKAEDDINIQRITPATETYENNQTLVSTNSSGIAIKTEIQDVPGYPKLNEAINSNLEESNLHEIQLIEVLAQNSDNFVAKTEITDGGVEYSDYNLNKPELNIDDDDDDDCSDLTENYCDNYPSINTEQDRAATIFERNISVTENTQLSFNFNQNIQNRNQIFISDNSSTLSGNELPQTFTVKSSDGLKLKISKNTINGNNNDAPGKNKKILRLTRVLLIIFNNIDGKWYRFSMTDYINNIKY